MIRKICEQTEVKEEKRATYGETTGSGPINNHLGLGRHAGLLESLKGRRFDEYHIRLEVG